MNNKLKAKNGWWPLDREWPKDKYLSHLAVDNCTKMWDLRRFSMFDAILTKWHNEWTVGQWVLTLPGFKPETEDTTSWKYYINEYGFRGEFDLESDKPKLGVFGDSFSFAQGVDWKDSWGTILANGMGWNQFNFGYCGASQEVVVRTFMAATKIIDFDYAVVVLPHWTRTGILAEWENKTLSYRAVMPHFPSNYIDRQDQENLVTMSDMFYKSKTLMMVDMILWIAKTKNINIVVTSWDIPVWNWLNNMYDRERTICQVFPNLDNKKARDGQHPGNLSHNTFGNYLINSRKYFL